MKTMQCLLNKPELSSLVIALIGSITAIAVAITGWLWSLHVAKVTLKAESNRLIAFHKLEIYENAIEEINFLVPLYKQLWHDAYEKRSPTEIRPALPALRNIIDTILEYQKTHNALGKAQVYSEALKEYVPFVANPACIDYIRQLDSVSTNMQNTQRISIENEEERIMEMYLIDELCKYEQCAEELKAEIEHLELFKR